MTSDQGNNSGEDSRPRLAPRPISRPPVDAASRQAFGRPDGLQGSFVAERVRPQKYRDQAEFRPIDQPADPVLEEAFSRPAGGTDSLQRHPFDAGALAAEKNGADHDEPDDPWRDPSAAAALGSPAVATPVFALSRTMLGSSVPSSMPSARAAISSTGCRSALIGGSTSSSRSVPS